MMSQSTLALPPLKKGHKSLGPFAINGAGEVCLDVFSDEVKTSNKD